MPIRPVISHLIPVSSRVSRIAAAGRDSPRSIAPPGTAQLPLSLRRIIGISPVSSVTTTFTNGTRLLGSGTAGAS